MSIMHKKEKIKMTVFLICFLIVVVVFGVGLKIMDNHMKEKDVSDKYFLRDEDEITEVAQGSVKLEGQVYEYFHQFETFLVIGTDNSGKDSAGYQGGMSDFLMLIAFDKTDNKYAFVPINRDTITKVHLIDENGEGEATADIQICTAHWYGGDAYQSCENTARAVSDMFGGIHIDGYYSLPMDAIARLNDEVGGVTVTLLEDFSDVDKTMTQGSTLTLTGEQAYHYIHDRFGVGDEKNISRMERQQQYMKALFKKAKDSMQQDKTYADRIFKDMEDVAVSDMSAKKVTKMAYSVAKGTSMGFFDIKGKNKVGQLLGDGIDHAEFYADRQSVVETMQKIYGLKKRNDDGN